MDLEKEIDGTLLWKYVNETANRAEREQVNSWLAEDDTNSDTLLQVARIYHAQHTRQRILQRNPHKALTRFNQRLAQRSRNIFFRRLAVAASFLIGIAGISTLLWHPRQDEAPPQMITVTTNSGTRSQLTLPDGTTVHLNAGSTLVYPSQYNRNERRVHLSGEGCFKVAHNAGQPFIVSTFNDRMNVQVSGTEFNMQAYESDSLVQTTLIEGCVHLSLHDKSEKILLNSSDKVTYNIKTGQIQKEKVNTEQVTAWVDGHLIFKDTPMLDVLRQLTHFFSVDFEVQDEVIYGYTFTGTFENRPLFQILEYVKISSKIDFTMKYSENQEIRTPVIHLTKIKP